MNGKRYSPPLPESIERLLDAPRPAAPVADLHASLERRWRDDPDERTRTATFALIREHLLVAGIGYIAGLASALGSLILLAWALGK